MKLSLFPLKKKSVQKFTSRVALIALAASTISGAAIAVPSSAFAMPDGEASSVVTEVETAEQAVEPTADQAHTFEVTASMFTGSRPFASIFSPEVNGDWVPGTTFTAEWFIGGALFDSASSDQSWIESNTWIPAEMAGQNYTVNVTANIPGQDPLTATGRGIVLGQWVITHDGERVNPGVGNLLTGVATQGWELPAGYTYQVESWNVSCENSWRNMEGATYLLQSEDAGCWVSPSGSIFDADGNPFTGLNGPSVRVTSDEQPFGLSLWSQNNTIGFFPSVWVSSSVYQSSGWPASTQIEGVWEIDGQFFARNTVTGSSGSIPAGQAIPETALGQTLTATITVTLDGQSETATVTSPIIGGWRLAHNSPFPLPTAGDTLTLETSGWTLPAGWVIGTPTWSVSCLSGVIRTQTSAAFDILPTDISCMVLASASVQSENGVSVSNANASVRVWDGDQSRPLGLTVWPWGEPGSTAEVTINANTPILAGTHLRAVWSLNGQPFDAAELTISDNSSWTARLSSTEFIPFNTIGQFLTVEVTAELPGGLAEIASGSYFFSGPWGLLHDGAGFSPTVGDTLTAIPDGWVVPDELTATTTFGFNCTGGNWWMQEGPTYTIAESDLGCTVEAWNQMFNADGVEVGFWVTDTILIPSPTRPFGLDTNAWAQAPWWDPMAASVSIDSALYNGRTGNNWPDGTVFEAQWIIGSPDGVVFDTAQAVDQPWLGSAKTVPAELAGELVFTKVVVTTQDGRSEELTRSTLISGPWELAHSGSQDYPQPGDTLSIQSLGWQLPEPRFGLNLRGNMEGDQPWEITCPAATESRFASGTTYTVTEADLGCHISVSAMVVDNEYWNNFSAQTRFSGPEVVAAFLVDIDVPDSRVPISHFGDWARHGSATAEVGIPASQFEALYLYGEQVPDTALTVSASPSGGTMLQLNHAYLAPLERGQQYVFIAEFRGEIPVVQLRLQPGEGFVDVPSDSNFHEHIHWMLDTGLSTGWPMPDGTREFRRGNAMLRNAMAAFLFRISGEEDTYVAPDTNTFVDVPVGAAFYREIEWMAERGISTGWPLPDGGREFRPAAPLTRESAAAFLYRLAGAEYTASGTMFADVAGTRGEIDDAIEWMAFNGIATGTNQPEGLPRFNPGGPLTREAMAAFIFRAVNEAQVITVN